jgi:hypothetical protein
MSQVDLVLVLEPELTDLVRETKFRVFNAEWLNAVENDDDHDEVSTHSKVCDSLLTVLKVRASRWRRISVSQLRQHLGRAGGALEPRPQVRWR